MRNEPVNSRTRLLIADDHPIFRDGLRRLLESEPGFEVVGEATDGTEAIRLVQEQSPDILLLDQAMPRVTGIEALRALEHARTPVRTILLTAHIERAQIVTALQLGARGVVLKEAATQTLFKCIRSVMEGQYWVDRERVADLIQVMRDMTAQDDAGRKANFGLTRRELDIVGAVVSGAANKEIASRFSISEDTVKHHLTNIFDKTGVSSRLELAMFAVDHRLVDRA